MNNRYTHRRTLLKGASAALALTALSKAGFSAITALRTYKVALIKTGWYGKNDLFRLIQVAPVEVLALCDVYKNQLSEAAAMVRVPTK